MTVKEVFKQLETLSDKRVKAHNTKSGVGENQFGVKLGDLRKIAKKIKSNHMLALELWETGNFDAQMLAILIIQPKKLTADELDNMVRSVLYARVADWLNAYVVKIHPDNEILRLKWMTDDNAMAARAGWNLTSIRIIKNPEMVDIPALLDRLEAEMGTAHPDAQWTMNFSLAEIGVNHPEYRKRALAIGEKLGIYSELRVPKGCTSPYAPLWINEMVSRQK